MINDNYICDKKENTKLFSYIFQTIYNISYWKINIAMSTKISLLYQLNFSSFKFIPNK